MPKKNAGLVVNGPKDAPVEASKRQRWMLRLITGVDNRGVFVSATDASEAIGEYFFAKAKKDLMAGKPYATTFEADAKRVYAWGQADKSAPEMTCVLKGREWVFTPLKATASGFPTR